MATVTKPQSTLSSSPSGAPDPVNPPSPSRFTFPVPRFAHSAFRNSESAIGSFLATRAVVGLAAWMGVSEVIRSGTVYHKGPVVEAALMWDASWYMGIAQSGYHMPVTGTSNLAFP